MRDLKAVQPDEMKVVRASDKHVPAVVQIAGEAGLSHWSFDDYILETCRHNSIFLVVEISPCYVIGFIVGRIVPGVSNSESLTSEIYNIAVIPDFRKRGIGSKLLSNFIQISSSCGVGEVILEVRGQNVRARKFYASHGFKPCGERKGFYLDPADHAIIMKSML